MIARYIMWLGARHVQMKYPCVWHDTSVCVTWHVWNDQYEWHNTSVRVRWHINVCEMTPPWNIKVCDMTPQCVALSCIVLHHVAVCCSVLQCVAVCCSVWNDTSICATWHIQIYSPHQIGDVWSMALRHEISQPNTCMCYHPCTPWIWHTYTYIMAHIWMSHDPIPAHLEYGTYTDVMAHTCEWVVICVHLEYGTHTHTSWHMYEWVMTQIRTRATTRVLFEYGKWYACE